ncbi:MAG: benzoyl-CoA reductase, bzd-type, subunit N [Anaerolineae bacterium]|nr:MAG: benzoyl-CoA reductase, bzd-type, subunit N [Anaerolineae bacterium]
MEVDMFGQFQDWFENRHEYAQEWKVRTGGKVLGYFCTYVPEEILIAADVLPVRIMGSHEPLDLTEPYIFGMFCPFCRDCLNQGLQGRYDYLDGVAIAQSCLHIRQTFNAWRKHLPREFNYYLYMPNNIQTKAARPYLAGELATFKQAVEEWVGREITDADLDRGIEIMNENRRLMREIYETRQANAPPLTGLEAMYMVVAGQMTEKQEHSAEMARILNGLPNRANERETGERLMILGSENDDTEFIEMVESLGATVVVDDHCTGSRYFWNEVDPVDKHDGDRLMAIASRYVDRPACPSKDWPARTRFPHIMGLADDYRVDGVILIQQKFCDPHELDIPPLTWAFEERDLKTLFLEFDVTVPVGQFQTRVEAFLEMIREEDLFA